MRPESKQIIVGRDCLQAFARAFETRVTTETISVVSPFEQVKALIEAELPAAIAAINASDRGDGVLVAPDHAFASLLQAFLAERGGDNAVQLLAREKLVASPHTDGFEAKFDEQDIAGWIANFLPSYLLGRFRKRAWIEPSETPVTIPDNARVAILGDWGSGLYGAPVIAQTIANMIPKYDALVHLGDVYYAGTKTEVEQRFLWYWPGVADAKSFALNSNHEMYSGGEGYFDKTLADPRFHHRSSCFAFQNSNFLFLGLDTAYEDFDVSDRQFAWINRRVAEAEGRRVVFLSHHQPFSLYESASGNLIAKLQSLLSNRRVFAWYWGHEHRCVIFEYHEGYGLWGRCVGHGGYPAFRDEFGSLSPAQSSAEDSRWFSISRDAVSGFVLDGPNPYVRGEEGRYSPNGFLSLDLNGANMHETVLSPSGDVLLTRTLL